MNCCSRKCLPADRCPLHHVACTLLWIPFVRNLFSVRFKFRRTAPNPELQLATQEWLRTSSLPSTVVTCARVEQNYSSSSEKGGDYVLKGIRQIYFRCFREM
jgi:hypothetical protein